MGKSAPITLNMKKQVPNVFIGGNAGDREKRIVLSSSYLRCSLTEERAIKTKRVVIISLCMICCIGWSLNIMAAKYDPLVEKAQQRLIELGYDPGPADGKMGGKTETAIKQFQQDNGLTM